MTQLKIFSKSSVLLVVLLVVASSIAAFQYNQNAQLLAQSEELGIAGSITVGLTFLWQLSPEWLVAIQGFNVSDLQRIVDTMNNVEWAGSGVYFFIRYAGPEKFMSDGLGPACTPPPFWQHMDILEMQPWGAEAWQLFPEKDIPVGIFDNVGTDENGSPVAGCVLEPETQQVFVAIALPRSEHNVTVNTNEGPKLGTELQLDVEASVGILTHELLHVFGFSDEDLKAKNMYYPQSALPAEWIPRIQAAAKAFESAPTIQQSSQTSTQKSPGTSGGGIPGFQFESIFGGLLAGVAVLIIIRHRRENMLRSKRSISPIGHSSVSCWICRDPFHTISHASIIFDIQHDM